MRGETFNAIKHDRVVEGTIVIMSGPNDTELIYAGPIANTPCGIVTDKTVFLNPKDFGRLKEYVNKHRN